MKWHVSDIFHYHPYSVLVSRNMWMLPKDFKTTQDCWIINLTSFHLKVKMKMMCCLWPSISLLNLQKIQQSGGVLMTSRFRKNTQKLLNLMRIWQRYWKSKTAHHFQIYFWMKRSYILKWCQVCLTFNNSAKSSSNLKPRDSFEICSS